MFALTFCKSAALLPHTERQILIQVTVKVGVLHVPINIPAIALSANEDNVDVDRELRAHGWSNTLSGLCGSVQVCTVT